MKIVGWKMKIIGWITLILLWLFMLGLGNFGPLSPVAQAFIRLLQGPLWIPFLIIILVIGGLGWIFFLLPAMFCGLFSGGNRDTWKVRKRGRDSYIVQEQGKDSFNITVQKQGKCSYTAQKK